MSPATPEQWASKRLRYLTSRSPCEKRRKLLAAVSEVSFVPMDAVGEEGQLDLSETRPVDEVRSGYSRFFDGDVVIAKITPCFENGKGALIRGTLGGVGYGTAELHVLTPTLDLDERYLYYVTVDPSFRQLGAARMTGAAGRRRVPEDFVRDFKVRVPPRTQQSAIADYLDRATARLDALIVAKQRMLELLAEKRRALITRAVTRGLDPGTPLRDPGIPWLEKIPVHWEVWKLGHFALIGNGSTPDRTNTAYWSGGTVPWLESSVVNNYEVTSADQFVTEAALRKCHLPLVKSGSVLVAITGKGKTRGKAVVLSIDATINQHLAHVSPDPSRLDPWFLRWTLLSAYEFLRSIGDGAGGTNGAITCEDLTNIRVPVPPVREQRAIGAKVVANTEELESLRKTVTRAMELLKERRATLIASAVSGQRDVARAA